MTGSHACTAAVVNKVHDTKPLTCEHSLLLGVVGGALGFLGLRLLLRFTWSAFGTMYVSTQWCQGSDKAHQQYAAYDLPCDEKPQAGTAFAAHQSPWSGSRLLQKLTLCHPAQRWTNIRATCLGKTKTTACCIQLTINAYTLVSHCTCTQVALVSWYQ